MSLSNLRVNVIFPARFHIRGLRTNLLQTGQDVRVYEVVLMGVGAKTMLLTLGHLGSLV